MNIGEKIKGLRKKYNIKSFELADKIGISKIFLSNIETGKRNPSSEVVKKMCEIFQISLSEFYEGVESNEAPKIKTIGEQLDEFLKTNGINPNELSIENQKRIAEQFANLYMMYADKK